MARYFVRSTKPRADADWSEDIPRPSNLEACDHEATPTGVLDADGNEIWRAPNPIGFIWHD